MKNIFTFTIAFFLLITIQAQTKTFDTLLKTNVDKNGNVNYKGLKNDEAKLDTYLDYAKSFVDYVRERGSVGKLPKSEYSTQAITK